MNGKDCKGTHLGRTFKEGGRTAEVLVSEGLLSERKDCRQYRGTYLGRTFKEGGRRKDCRGTCIGRTFK